jgi:pimeloyl-ACP methyl ester carboxylesterase
MTRHFVMSARAVRGGRFLPEPGPSAFLLVPEGERPAPRHAVATPDAWFRRLRRAAVWGRDARRGGVERGDVLVFVHGYNNDLDVVMRRHARLSRDLATTGFKGAVMSFDWPSADAALNYLEDRHDAKKTAMQLVDDGIRTLAREQTPDCSINIHLLGHSTGAYVIREAFDDADDAALDGSGWLVSQVAFIGADVSSGSLGAASARSESLYRHCTRLTNYSNRMDSVLKLSNAKRLGVAPRAGRAGLPPGAPVKAVDVDCTAYFESLQQDAAVRLEDQREEIGAFDHSWHIGNSVFARDLFETLKGDIERSAIPTRREDGGRIALVRPE